MKGTTRNTMITLVGIAFGLVGLLGPLFELPQWTVVFFLAFPISLWVVIWLQRRAKARGDTSLVPATPGQNRRYSWAMLLGLALACLVSPFLLSYSGSTLPFRTLVIISLVTFCVLALLTIVLRRRREKT
jgi:hypothetical protein